MDLNSILLMIFPSQRFYRVPPTSMTENAPNQPTMTSVDKALFPVNQLSVSQLVPLQVSMLCTGSGISPNSLPSTQLTLKSIPHAWMSKSLLGVPLDLDLVPALVPVQQATTLSASTMLPQLPRQPMTAHPLQLTTHRHQDAIPEPERTGTLAP